MTSLSLAILDTDTTCVYAILSVSETMRQSLLDQHIVHLHHRAIAMQYIIAFNRASFAEICRTYSCCENLAGQSSDNPHFRNVHFTFDHDNNELISKMWFSP